MMKVLTFHELPYDGESVAPSVDRTVFCPPKMEQDHFLSLVEK